MRYWLSRYDGNLAEASVIVTTYFQELSGRSPIRHVVSDPNNPYLSPQTQPSTSSPEKSPRLDVLGLVAISTIVGGMATAIAIYLVYANDPRTGTSGPSLRVVVLSGTALSSAIWAISGCFQRRGIAGLAVTFVVAAASAGMWIGLGGTYADVLGAAACVAWPCGGLVASVCIYRWARLHRASRLTK